jgi:ribonuclease P protein component
MISKKKRFTRAEFTAFSAEKTLTQAYNQLGTVKFTPATTFTMGVVTSGKHCKSAVGRNKFRRRIYSFFDQEDKKNSFPYHLVLFASKASYTFSYEELTQVATDLISRIRRATK